MAADPRVLLPDKATRCLEPGKSAGGYGEQLLIRVYLRQMGPTARQVARLVFLSMRRRLLVERYRQLRSQP